jgi:hypothetical protein
VLLAFQREEVDFIIEMLETSTAFNVSPQQPLKWQKPAEIRKITFRLRSAWVGLAKYFCQLSASSSFSSIIYV